ncbi:MAG: agmatinase [Desulfomicrobiaceae bacterium]|jgi:agmatinase|nr:agmatinase [Desulfomicrobiaceae bacterium]
MECFDLHGTPRGRRIAVLPVPFEGAVSYGQGAALGPQAFLEATTQIESYDPQLDRDLSDLAHFTVLPPVTGTDAAMVHAAMQKVLAALDPSADTVLLVGGDHSVPLPLMAWYHAAFADMAILHLDAHADLRDQYQGSSLSHACIMARARQLGIPIFQLGIRSVCPEEMAVIRTAPDGELQTRFAWELESPEAEAARVRAFVGARPMYVSLDVDALDPSVLPGTGTPEPGGIEYRWLQEFWRHLWMGGGPRLLGLDVCELAPLSGSQVSQSVAAKVVHRMLVAWLGAGQ